MSAARSSSILANGTDTTTALALLFDVPEISAIRAKHDKAFPRWPNHINLIFPFVPRDQFDSVRERLTKALSDQPTFAVRLDTVGSFAQGKAGRTYHAAIDVSADLAALFRRVREALPEVPVKHAEFHPHLTIAQGPPGMEASLTQSLAPLTGRDFRVSQLCMLSRAGNTPFEIVHAVQFGGNDASNGSVSVASPACAE